jgi:hypothetical protein
MTLLNPDLVRKSFSGYKDPIESGSETLDVLTVKMKFFLSGSDYSPRTISVLGLEDISPERGPTFPPEEEEEEEVKETHPHQCFVKP